MVNEDLLDLLEQAFNAGVILGLDIEREVPTSRRAPDFHDWLASLSTNEDQDEGVAHA